MHNRENVTRSLYATGSNDTERKNLGIAQRESDRRVRKVSAGAGFLSLGGLPRFANFLAGA